MYVLVAGWDLRGFCLVWYGALFNYWRECLDYYNLLIQEVRKKIAFIVDCC